MPVYPWRHIGGELDPAVPWIDQDAVVDVLEESLLHLHHGPRVHVPQHHAEEDEHRVRAEQHLVCDGALR